MERVFTPEAVEIVYGRMLRELSAGDGELADKLYWVKEEFGLEMRKLVERRITGILVTDWASRSRNSMVEAATLTHWPLRAVEERTAPAEVHRSVPICDTCWTTQEGGKAPVRVVEDRREEEECYACGEKTRSGIYARRVVPATV